MKIKIAAVAALLVLLLVSRFAGSGGTPDFPEAEAGVLDLSNWRASEGEVVPLSGEWEFYPETLAEPRPGGGFAWRQAPVPIKVPGKWDRKMEPGKISPYGFGTYRLTLKLPNSPGTSYALRVGVVRTAHRLYVDGRLAGGQGVPGTESGTTKPRVLPYTVQLGTKGGTAEIVISAANFDYGTGGGLFEAVRFGTTDAIEREVKLKLIGNAILMGFYLVSGMYFLFLFFFRRKNKELFHFSMFFWMSFLFWATHGDRLLFWSAPQLNYDWQTKLQTLSSIGLYGSLFLFVRSMLPGNGRRKAFRAIDAATGLIVAMILCTRASFFSRFELALIGVDVVMFVCSVGILLAASFKRKSDSVYALLAAVCIVAESLFQAYYYVVETSVMTGVPLERILFMLVMASFVAHRFFDGMKQNETLSGQLLVADRLKDDFLANASQEIRVPLHGMINLVQLMLGAGGQTADKQEERLTLLLATGRRLANKLEENLDLIRLNDSGIELRLRTVDLRPTINGALEVMAYMTDRNRISFENRTRPGVPYAWADEQRVMEILFNLLHYLESSGITGKVAVQAEAARNGKEIRVSLRARGNVAERSPDGRETETNLQLGRKLVELHGGTFQHRASAFRGIRLSFTLPISERQHRPLESEEAESEVAATSERAGEAGLPGGPKVLLVADDPVATSIMEDLLKQEGMQVYARSDGAQGLRLWEKEPDWDLVILDVMLPWISGYEICRTIRARHSFYELPVLFLTSRNQPADLLVGFHAGANDYLTLPLDASEFRARVRTLLKMKQSIRELLTMEMALFQAQIKPHFLYNTLNTIASLSEIDPDKTRDLLNDFGTYLRGSFDLRNMDKRVPFSKEWALVQSYLQIEQARFGARIRVNVSFAAEQSFFLPPLTLQPLVENAVRHGILPRFEGGVLEIGVVREPEGYRVTVRDDGVGFPPGRLEEVLSGDYRAGIGVSNVHKRLMNAYGTGISIVSDAGSGTEVSFFVPGHKEESP